MTAIVVASAAPAAAQPLTSRVEGAVSDETGAVIPGASVTMTEIDTGIAQVATTDERGLYLFPPVTAGTYQVAGSVPGFATTPTTRSSA
ncbi:MAG: carboxypeptidase regulatory-like domain-containing protein [Acidobacteria bacterium]|nr:carboxypeptidase regulatory-like domain-containing protein [Acidobacteriota bacterium]